MTCLLLDADVLPEALTTTQGSGVAIRTERLDPAEFRWQVENALDARAVHDSDGLDEGETDLPVDGDGPGYPALAVLLRSRMTALPAPSKPPASRGDTE